MYIHKTIFKLFSACRVISIAGSGHRVSRHSFDRHLRQRPVCVPKSRYEYEERTAPSWIFAHTPTHCSRTRLVAIADLSRFLQADQTCGGCW